MGIVMVSVIAIAVLVEAAIVAAEIATRTRMVFGLFASRRAA